MENNNKWKKYMASLSYLVFEIHLSRRDLKESFFCC